MLARLRGNREAPQRLELAARLGVLDVLEAGELVGQGAHVAATLDVVLAPDRHEPGAVAADVPGEQRQVDERQHVVGGVVVLGDAERPAELRRLGRGVVVRHLADHVCRHPGDGGATFERPLVDGLGVGVEPGGRVTDELFVGEAGGDDLATDGVGEGDVGADVDAEPDVGPCRRAGAARVDGVHLRPVADALDEVVEEDRVRLARVRAPQDDQSVVSISSYEEVPPPAPSTAARPATEGACQVRLQESMLFDPNATRENFCAR